MSLQVWMPLNGDIRNYGLNCNVSPFRFEGVTFVDGKIGKCAQFPNDAAQFIYMNGLKLQTGSWCAWIKVLGEGASTSQRIISEGRDTGSIGTNIFVSKAGTTLSFTSHKKSIVVNNAITLNKWTHVAATFGNGKLTLYVNGSQVATTTYTEDSDYAQSQDKLVLGKMSYGWTSLTNYFPFNGQICDFRVYDNALSPREVKEISKGLVLHYPLAMPGQENLIVNSSGYGGINGWNVSKANSLSVVDDSGNKCLKITSVSGDTNRININQSLNSKIDINNLTTYTISFYYKAESTNNTLGVGAFIRIANSSSLYNDRLRSTSTLTLDNNWHFASITGDLSSFNGTGVTSVTLFLFAYKAAVYYSHIKFELGSIATPWIPNPADAEYSTLGFNDGIEYDVSGFCNNGTITGTLTYSTDTPRYKLSTYFANNNYIKFKLPENMYQITYSFWVKADTYNKYNAIVSRFSNPGGGNGGPWLSVNTEYVGAWAYIGKISPNYTKTNIGLLSTGEWHHLCWVFDNGSAKWYVDGQSASNTVTYVTTYLSNTEYSALGNSYTGTNWNGCVFDGYLSDFRVYATPLSADDIIELYHTPISLTSNGTLMTQGEYVEV